MIGQFSRHLALVLSIFNIILLILGRMLQTEINHEIDILKLPQLYNQLNCITSILNITLPITFLALCIGVIVKRKKKEKELIDHLIE